MRQTAPTFSPRQPKHILREIERYVNSLRATSKHKTTDEVLTEVTTYIQTLKESKEEEEIFITEDLSLTRYFESIYGKYNEFDAQKKAQEYYRARKFNECKLGAAHELVAIHIGDCGFAQNLCGVDVVQQFRSGTCWPYPFINQIFKALLQEQNFHY